LCGCAEDARHHATVEVYLPENEVVLGGGGGNSALTSSAAPTRASLIAKSISQLPLDLGAMVEYNKRKTISSDLGWKYEFWLDTGKKEFAQCILCKKAGPLVRH
jgi:hypothetical protein